MTIWSISPSLTPLLIKPDREDLDKTFALWIGICVNVTVVVYVSVPLLNFFFMGWVMLPRKLDKKNYLWITLDGGFNKVGQWILVLGYLISCFAVGLSEDPDYFDDK